MDSSHCSCPLSLIWRVGFDVQFNYIHIFLRLQGSLHDMALLVDKDMRTDVEEIWKLVDIETLINNIFIVHMYGFQ